MVKINTTQTLKNYEGEEMKVSVPNEEGTKIIGTKAMTLRRALGDVLTLYKTGTLEEVLTCHKLVRKIYDNDAVELSAEDIVLMKKAITADTIYQNNMIKGVLIDIIDPDIA